MIIINKLNKPLLMFKINKVINNYNKFQKIKLKKLKKNPLKDN